MLSLRGRGRAPKGFGGGGTSGGCKFILSYLHIPVNRIAVTYTVMVKLVFDRHMQYGSSSRTITLGLGYWAMLAEIQEMLGLDFKNAIKRAILECHKEANKRKQE